MDKIKIFGKAQDRTALGIVHAYMTMYSHATLADLRKTFPNELNPDEDVLETFIYADEKGITANRNGCSKVPDELLTMGDDRKVVFVSMWAKPNSEKIVRHATRHGIVIAEFEEAGWVGEKGGFRLRYLDGYIPPVAKERGPPRWLWLIIVLFLIGGVVAFFLLYKPKVVEVERIVTVEKIVYRDRVEKIEKDFSIARFARGKADLTDEAKFVLHDLVKLMETNPDPKLKVERHTSEEGDEAFSQWPSEERAQVAVDFLISQGISTDRLWAEDKGSSEPIGPDDPDVNRHTEFIVIRRARRGPSPQRS